MRTLAVLAGMVVFFAVGLRLMFYGFQGIVAAPSSLGLELLALAAGLLCLVAGLVGGVLLLKEHYQT